MPFIEYVVVDGVDGANGTNGARLSVGLGAREHPTYFSVDSMSLLLGRNGSGKTRLLLKAAEVLTQQAGVEQQGGWSERGPNDESTWVDASRSQKASGVVYFTPLPFRRSIGRSRGYVDASAIAGVRYRQQLAAAFPGIAAALGVKTHLVGRLVYRARVLQARIVPLLLSTRCRIHDFELEDWRRRLVKRSESQQVIHESERKRFSNSVLVWMRKRISTGGRTHMVASLAAIEHLGTSLHRRGAVTCAILQHLDLVSFDSQDVDPKIDVRSAVPQFERLRDDAVMAAGANAIPIKPRSVDGITGGVEFEVLVNSGSYESLHRIPTVELAWLNLSSGLISMVQQFTRLSVGLARLRARGFTSVIVMVDEGDAYLHLEWQRRYIEQIDAFMANQRATHNFEFLQVVLATHSPIISGDFPSSMIDRLGDLGKFDVKTFGSSLDNLVLEAFQTPSIGSFAAAKIRTLRSKVLGESLNAEDHRLLGEIGDSALRRAVVRPVPKHDGNEFGEKPEELDP
ncbi:hypothetical protein [Stenotrophomonas bentonitica]